MTLPTLPENYKRVLNLIKVGADNPTTGAEIALILKLEERTVQSIVSRLITRYGVPIVGVRHGAFRGYYIPANDTERLAGIRELKAQYDTEGKRLDVLVKADLESYKELLKGADQNV